MKIIQQSEPIDPSYPLLVFDASFNPPHRAHYAQVELATRDIVTNLLQSQSTSHNNNNKPPIKVNLLLSYSGVNADKGTASVQDQERRGEMIKLFAASMFPTNDHIGNTPIHWITAIAKSPSPKFVEKCRDIMKWLDYTNSPVPDIYFIMGFDTLVRFLDPKYYPPDPTLPGQEISSVVAKLNYFFKIAKIKALPRGEPDPEKSKREWITSNARTGIVYPEWWASRVEVLVFGSDADHHQDEESLGEDNASKIFGNIPLANVSSTAARTAAKENDYDTLLDLTKSPELVKYIKQNKIYLEN